MTLEAYRAKRRFDRTAEPSGEVAPRAVGAPRPESVLTGRTLAEVAAAGVGRTAEEAPLGAVAAIPGAEEAALPEVIAPTLATLAAAPPTRGEWVAEVKLDGYRLLAREEGAQVRLLMRSGRDWTGRFPAVAAAVRGLPADEAVLDGEIVVLDARGRPDFGAQQEAVHGGGGGIVYTVFDLLFQGRARPAPRAAARAQGGAPLPAQRGGGAAPLRRSRERAARRGVLPRGVRARARGGGVQAGGRAVSRGADAGVAEGEAPASRGAGRHRVHGAVRRWRGRRGRGG